MDKKRSKLNIAVSVLSKIVTVILIIFVRRELIHHCGNDVNGLNSLYISIVGFLSIAELGVGSAITYCMYKPIAEGDTQRVSELYHFFRRSYRIIGAIILTCGFVLTPFLRYLAKDYVQLDINLSVTFLLMVLSVVITYLYGEKSALINAHKDNYVTTVIDSGGLVVQYILQIICLRVTRSFEQYLFCRSITAVLQMAVTTYIVRKKYSEITSNYQKLSADLRIDVGKNIKALFMHKIGGLLVGSTGSILISSFIGVATLGCYSNYVSIQNSMSGILGLIFTSLTSIFGHLYVQKDKALTRQYCEVFYLLNFVLGAVFYLGYFAIVDNLVAILFSPDLVVGRKISFVITLNGFIQFMRRNTLTFRDATGTFYNDRWKPLIEGLINIILSIVFVKTIGVVGAITGTIVTNLFICHIVEPFVLYRNAFSASAKGYYVKNYSLIILFTVALFFLNGVMVENDEQWAELFINGFISLGISGLLVLVGVLINCGTCKQIKNFIK